MIILATYLVNTKVRLINNRNRAKKIVSLKTTFYQQVGVNISPIKVDKNNVSEKEYLHREMANY